MKRSVDAETFKELRREAVRVAVVWGRGGLRPEAVEDAALLADASALVAVTVSAVSGTALKLTRVVKVRKLTNFTFFNSEKFWIKKVKFVNFLTGGSGGWIRSLKSETNGLLLLPTVLQLLYKLTEEDKTWADIWEHSLPFSNHAKRPGLKL